MERKRKVYDKVLELGFWRRKNEKSPRKKPEICDLSWKWNEIPRQKLKTEQVSWKEGEIPRQNPQTERVLWKENEKSTTKH